MASLWKITCMAALAFLGSSVVAAQPGANVQSKQRISKTAQLVQRAMPAVVSVNAIGETDTINPFGNDPLAMLFFGVRPFQRRSSGSGVIVDPRGYVVTCSHVVQGARQIKVTLNTGVTLRANIIFQDKDLDLAVLELEGARARRLNLPYLPMASRLFEVGDSVIAIGNAFSVGQTVTKGIISAGYRVFGGNVVIQTDAQINPGNSGGPIVFYDGTVGGIASAIASRTGASHGVGFFIPAMAVQYALRRALDGLPPSKIPFRTVTVDPSIIEAFSEKGVSIVGGVSVMENGEFFHEGDIIVGVAGYPVLNQEIFEFFCKVIPVGERYRVDYYPQGDIGQRGCPQARTLYLTAIPRQETQGIRLQGQHILNGVSVSDLTPDLAAELGLPSQQKGVVVIDAPEYGALQPNDILLEFNGHLVPDVETLQEILAQPKKRGTSYRIQRGNAVIQQIIN